MIDRLLMRIQTLKAGGAVVRVAEKVGCTACLCRNDSDANTAKQPSSQGRTYTSIMNGKPAFACETVSADRS